MCTGLKWALLLVHVAGSNSTSEIMSWHFSSSRSPTSAILISTHLYHVIDSDQADTAVRSPSYYKPTTAIMTTTSTLTDSISSLGSASPSRAPSISRMYKQASQLFLTRQLADAWTVLSPLVNPQPIQNGSSDGESRDYEPRQIATASKSARVKVWGLWIALVHEVLLLGDTEGVIVMQAVEEQRGEGKSGAKRWKELARRVQEGGIWEDVVRVGYGGVEGAVDGEVVGNL